MFIQVIRAKAKDPLKLYEELERWHRELAPGAPGWVGATAGVGDDSSFVSVVRFASEEDARRNSERPEQGAWWESFSQHLTDPEFFDCREVEIFRSGGSDEARFVQVLFGRTTDRARARELFARFAELPDVRPDVIGGTTAWIDERAFVDTTYFTSEDEARAGERQEPPPEFKALFEEYTGLLEEASYVDIREPWLRSP